MDSSQRLKINGKGISPFPGMPVGSTGHPYCQTENKVCRIEQKMAQHRREYRFRSPVQPREGVSQKPQRRKRGGMKMNCRKHRSGNKRRNDRKANSPFWRHFISRQGNPPPAPNAQSEQPHSENQFLDDRCGEKRYCRIFRFDAPRHIRICKKLYQILRRRLEP